MYSLSDRKSVFPSLFPDPSSSVQKAEIVKSEKAGYDLTVTLKNNTDRTLSGVSLYLTGVDNIRDVIPHPRTVGNAEF